ncbi:hypothetical protein HPB49_024152 [Dermacentor silvarum]|uniref:Uncharacterized protein n=1 Tax=Dermacentor silvarum TaxID=543639 RepID=A0ACB8CTP5_DERSI|nr:hypothetical protein HPB49_024152 [Dermacentor silvarum]
MSSSPVLDLDRDWERDAFLDLFGLAGFDVLVWDLDRDSPLAFVLCSLCSEGHSSSSSSESSELSYLGPGGGCLGSEASASRIDVLLFVGFPCAATAAAVEEGAVVTVCCKHAISVPALQLPLPYSLVGAAPSIRRCHEGDTFPDPPLGVLLSRGNRFPDHFGVLMAGKGKNVGTVWLQHSVPRFLEDLEQGYVYPTSGRENGQLFLCLSMKLEAVEVVDIYTQGLSDQVKDNITVQSWRNGAGGAQETYCTRNYSVKDVILIGVQTGSGYAEFVSKEDHSKWCVAQHKGIFCISSLNRMDSQKKRGGEVTCLLDTNLAQLFRSTIAVSTKCE